MIINKILPNILQDDNKPVSVSIIDSGFSYIPSYGKIYGYNDTTNCKHGDKVLSVFTALDLCYPIKNLTLNLVSYNAKTEYRGLIKALNLLPQSDILSISIAWKEDKEQIKKLLFEKANIICVPYSKKSEIPYPSLYEGVITCSYINNPDADFSISPINQFKGNSFAVPAIARLLAYGHGLVSNNHGIPIIDLFSQYDKLKNINKNINMTCNFIKCFSCKKKLRSKYNTFLTQIPEKCPYCGAKLK